MNLNKRVILLNLFLLLFTQLSYSQNIDFAKSIVQKLASAEFYGRGYVNGGDSLAAIFLAQEFEKIGLKKFNDSYFQEFNMNVNIIHELPVLKFDTVNLSPVKDFIVIPSSPDIDKKFKIRWVDSRTLTNQYALKHFLNEDHSQNFVCIDSTNLNNKELFTFANTIFSKNYFNAAGIIEQNSRLKFTVSTKVNDYVNIQLKPEKIVYDADSVYIKIKNNYKKHHTARNIIAYLPGITDSIVMLTAHYDHLGMFGDVIFLGANDNASGVAMVLSLAKYYKEIKKKKYTLVFVLFAAEEAGLLGSKFMVDNMPFDINKIKVLLNFDMVGSGDKGVYVMNAKLFPDIDSIMNKLNNTNQYFDVFHTTGISYGSDHASFYEKGVKALFVYTDGDNSTYHQPEDTFESCSFASFQKIIKFVTDFINEY